jgi:small subunit ribosomal protein S6
VAFGRQFVYIQRLRPHVGVGFFVSCSARTGAGPSCPKEGDQVRDYEVVYIFDSSLEEPKITEKIDRFQQLVAGDGNGEVTAVDHWGRRELAYPIRDKDNGYYVVAHISTTADRLPEFERLLQLDEELLRYLIVVNEGDLQTSIAPVAEDRDDDDSDEEE